VAEGEIYPERMMAMKAGQAPDELEGITSKEPSFGLPVVWIDPAAREEATLMDYTVVDPESVMITHLSEILRKHAHEILNRQDVQELVDNLKQSHPALVEGVIPDVVSIATLQQVVQNLLAEGVPVNDLARIVEACANHIGQTQSIAALSEKVRKALRWAICGRFSDSRGNLYALTLDPGLEDEISRAGQQGSGAGNLSPARIRRVGEVICENAQQWNQGESDLVLVVAPELRHQVRDLFGPFLPEMPIIAYDELCDSVRLHTVDIVTAAPDADHGGETGGRGDGSSAPPIADETAAWSHSPEESLDPEMVMTE
jgi:flagellar biosynthesis protein FlhA